MKRLILFAAFIAAFAVAHAQPYAPWDLVTYQIDGTGTNANFGYSTIVAPISSTAGDSEGLLAFNPVDKLYYGMLLDPTLKINWTTRVVSVDTTKLGGKRRETYSGATNSSGIYTITYATAFTVAPNVQFQLGLGASNKETILLSTSTTTGCSFYVQLRADVLGLLPSYSNVNARNVDVLVTEK